LLSAYCHIFDLTGIAFRFANIVGPGQTHGIAVDFVEKLRRNPHELQILGNGTQTKSYIHSNDALDAVFLAHSNSSKKFDVFNVAGNDAISVNQIAQIAIQEVVGADAQVELKYTGGDRGWKGDVPTVLLNTDKIKSLGFSPRYSSEEAIQLAIRSMVDAQKSDALR
jgi:UDP-glucose 4-epimerase